MKNWKNEDIKDCFDYWEGQMIDGKFGEKKGTSGFCFCREIISMFGERKLGSKGKTQIFELADTFKG